MTKLFFAGMMAVLTLSALAAPEALVSKSGSGTTSATVYFEPGPQAATLVTCDVTSDKAASVVSWQVGGTALTLLAPAANNVTNLLTSIGTVASNASIVSVTAAGVITPHLAFTNVLVTNVLVTLANPLGTNTAAASSAREVTSTYLPVVGTSSTNVVLVTSNATSVAYALTVGTNLVFRAGSLAQLNQVKSWITNAGNFELTLSNNFAFVPERAHVLTTNLYTNTFAATATASDLVLDTGTGLVPGDSLLVLPSTGGSVLLDLVTTNEFRYQHQTIKAATGVALAAGERLFVLNTAITSPLGATTLRLYGDAIRVLPANVPAVLSVDGTSACAVNAAVVRYY